MTTVNRYPLRAELLADWGVHRQAERLREEFDEERGPADRFLERLIHFEGEPDMQSLDEFLRPKTARDIFEKQLEMELEDSAGPLRREVLGDDQQQHPARRRPLIALIKYPQR